MSAGRVLHAVCTSSREKEKANVGAHAYMGSTVWEEK